MRTFAVTTLIAITACGNDSKPDVDAPSENLPPPRVIPGGGIGDGAIDGVVNLYVIDDVSRKPISGAGVRVGSIDGTTDSTGLFVAHDVHGPQTITAKANGFRTEVWVGVNGANVTLDLNKANDATPDSAKLSGQIANWAALTVAAGHAKVGVVTYSQSDNLGDAANNIAQLPANQNMCITVQAADPCNFTVTSRTGNVALIAAVFDRDLKGTPNDPNDDTMTLIRWAVRAPANVTAGANQTGMDLTLLNVGDLQTITVDFGSPPSALLTVAGLIGIDIGNNNVLQLPSGFVTPAANTMLVPRLSAITNATGYRLSAIANNGQPAGSLAQSVVLRKNQTGTTLQAGMWLAPPTGASLSRTTGSWTNAVGATVHGVEITQGATKVANITMFDNSATMTIPSLVTLPSGSLTAKVQAIGAPDLDVTNFSLDGDKNKLVMVGAQDTTIN